jgi:DNA-binding CsgD family transcriptional regulator
MAQMPVINFLLVILNPEADAMNFMMETLQQSPEIYYSGLSFIIIIDTFSCLLAARWLREAALKPPLKISVVFSLLFILFTFTIIIWFTDFIQGIHISYLSTAIMGTFFIGILLFFFFLYTRLIKVNTSAGINENVKTCEYEKYIQQLSRRELDVIEAILAGNYSYKELSNTLDISVNTVRTHIKHIYKTTGVSNMTALISLFRGFSPLYPKFLLKPPAENS